MAGAALLFVALAVAFPVVLYVLVRAEHDRREEMDRQVAERAARRDTRDGNRERE